MKLSAETISALEKVISGNPASNGAQYAPYRTGYELVQFFRRFGRNDTYGQSFPSRAVYVEDVLRELNGTDAIGNIVQGAVDPRAYLGSDFEVEGAVCFLNSYLRYDGYELHQVGDFYQVDPRISLQLAPRLPFSLDDRPDYEFLREQLRKCDEKLERQDYDGAITNARSLVESVLVEMERRLASAPEAYDGDLIRMYKRVQKLLHLDPARQDITNSLRQILSGLISIVSGIGAVRNQMGDAHARSYKPSRHHAELAVNSARTVTAFLFATYEHQQTLGNIKNQ